MRDFSGRRVPFILLPVFLLSLSLTCSGREPCRAAADEVDFYLGLTAGIRARERPGAFFSEQAVRADGLLFWFAAAADDSLRNARPADGRERLENLLLDLMADDDVIYCLDREAVGEFLSGKIDGREAARRMALSSPENGADASAGVPVDRLQAQALKEKMAVRALHEKYNAHASLVGRIVTDRPHNLDAAFCRAAGLPYPAGLLHQDRVPYRVIGSAEYGKLSAAGYPLLPLLLCERPGRVVNMLPNCAQGATQIISGAARYTKAVQLARDERGLFRRVSDGDGLRPGDCVVVVWEPEAGATVNSGHVGVVADVDYASDGSVRDATLVEFFPANGAPRLVSISRSLYEGWRASLAGDGGGDVRFLRPRREEAAGSLEAVRRLAAEKYPDRSAFVVF